MNKKSFKIVFLLLLIACSIISCDNEISIPKPSTHLMVDLPEHSYQKFSDSSYFSFEIPKLWSVSKDPQRIYDAVIRGYRKDLKDKSALSFFIGKKINGDIHIQYYKIDTTNTVAKLVNETGVKIDEHKMRAQQVTTKDFIFRDKKVYGTLFEFVGNSAVNFEFHLTDSVDNFVRTAVILYTTPNYDSLQPTLNYIKTDLIHLINTFEWKKQ